MADTARANEAAGLPRQRVETRIGEDNAIAFTAFARFKGFEVSWDDLPCNWVKERWFQHRRLPNRGPFSEVDASFELTPTEDGSLGRYRFSVVPQGVLGWLVGRMFLRGAERNFRRLSAEAARWLAGRSEQPFQAPRPILPEAAVQRARRIAGELRQGTDHDFLVDLLLDLVLNGAECDTQRIRPLALARQWQAQERTVVELCLEATRAGLLDLHWDLLCPRCRGAKASVTSLDQLPRGAHCDSCNIDYGRDFARNVELSFSPAAAIRPIGTGAFCLLGPQSTPHIWAHLTLAPGERLTVEVTPPAGAWRLRTLEAGPQLDLDHAGGPFPGILVGHDGIATAPPAEHGLVLENRSERTRTVVIEDRRWTADALTADRVVASQTFRDLFTTQVLRPGDEVGIGRVTLLFSDLRASTAMYEQMGDAAAYHVVREHFAYIAGIVREEDGAVVKTIGDAVMAAFSEPAAAVRAAITMQRMIAQFNAGSAHPIILKLGAHEGACIMVTLNDRLDYFGQTANLAARLQGQSRGGDLVLSASLAALPEVRTLVADLNPATETATLRGFAEPIDFLRLRF